MAKTGRVETKCVPSVAVTITLLTILSVAALVHPIPLAVRGKKVRNQVLIRVALIDQFTLTVHKTLADSMKERLEPFRSRNSLDMEPHETRGTYEECRFWARIISRESIDDDPHRSTGKVTFDVKNLGLTFIPGDRLAIMPLNSWTDIEVASFCTEYP